MTMRLNEKVGKPGKSCVMRLQEDGSYVWQFNRTSAASIAGVGDSQLASWLARYNLFPEKRQGRGFQTSFSIGDIMSIYAVNILIESNHMYPEYAVEVIRRIGGTYRFLMNPGIRNRDGFWSEYPGEITFFWKDDGRFVCPAYRGSKSTTRLQAWKIFDDVAPMIYDAVSTYPGHAESEIIRSAIEGYKSQMEELRQRLWA